MPLLRITVTEGSAALHGSSAPLLSALRDALAEDAGPITVMVHGFRYQPGRAGNCPHETLFAREPRTTRRIVGWPRHLGLRGQAGEGLGISFGWPARGTVWQAFEQADLAGRALATFLSDIRTLAPERPIHAIGHSMGARVILRAIRDSDPETLRRVILLAGAEFEETAKICLTSPAGLHTQVLNVTSRENDVFDFMLEHLITAPGKRSKMLGHAAGGSLSIPNMVTLQLDDANSLQALRRAGFRIAPAERRICHWSPYLRAGVFPLYRAFLSGQMPLVQLRATLPDTHAPRWSRLFPRPRSAHPVILTAH
ncbi:pimeloyl-ACP methyl ester carboxylesterase [Sagittula marina]|uniref:Pimeloyl-ACP methyl ester carboxylesterase n=1 Tax=Sagittula marina TaxID=943940 RepID=A0A7W6DJJ5_9RHOB|nr:DUF726 domain-containing protein [Sagittula marina]MBB3984430.1 pimeloyl-ACP methyl ester carboxylesterase [Sagittula marina]